MIATEISGPSIPRLSRSEIERFVTKCIRAIEKTRAAPFRAEELSLAFVTDNRMKSLNALYRGKRRTTDVLTFPADGSPALPGARRPLGEIVISLDQARRQAAEQRHSLATEIRYLLLHGILHAYGYDHETDEGEMNRLELKIRRLVGLD